MCAAMRAFASLVRATVKLEWQWVMNVEIDGQWISTNGYASLMHDQGRLTGRMCFQEMDDGQSNLYATFDGVSYEDNSIELTVRSSSEGVPDFTVSGNFFSRSDSRGEAYTLILTDGTTMLGFAKKL